MDYEVVGRVKSLMKSLTLRIGPTGKLLKNHLFPSFTVLNKRSIRLTECFMNPFEAKSFRASGYHPVDKDNWLVVHVSNT